MLLVGARLCQAKEWLVALRVDFSRGLSLKLRRKSLQLTLDGCLVSLVKHSLSMG